MLRPVTSDICKIMCTTGFLIETCYKRRFDTDIITTYYNTTMQSISGGYCLVRKDMVLRNKYFILTVVDSDCYLEISSKALDAFLETHHSLARLLL